MTETRKPWEQLEGETAKAYLAFQHYLQLGPKERSIVKAYRRYSSDDTATRAPGYFDKWASGNDWTKRVEAYDETVAVSALEAREEARQKAYQELADHALEAARVHIGIMLGTLDRPEAELNDDGNVVGGVSIQDRRLAASEVLDRVGVLPPKNLAGHLQEDDDELERIPYDARQALLRAMSESLSPNGKKNGAGNT